MNKPIVIADIPRCGLGNKMLVWAKALLFANAFDLPLYTFGWEQLNVGPLLRRERSNRYYGGYFKKNGSFFERIKVRKHYQKTTDDLKLIEPGVNNTKGLDVGKYHYIVFNAVPEWDNYFGDINGRREMVREVFLKMIRPSLLRQLDQQTSPGIGMHIRLGDFRVPGEGESFKKTGGIRTPMPYFIETLQRLREIIGTDLPATVFTNGKDAELKNILALPNVSIAPKNPDIVDLLLLGRSKVIVTSARSTFGYWSGFLSEAPIIMHPDHLFGNIRSATDNAKYFEGAFTDPCPQLLKERLIGISENKSPNQPAPFEKH